MLCPICGKTELNDSLEKGSCEHCGMIDVPIETWNKINMMDYISPGKALQREKSTQLMLRLRGKKMKTYTPIKKKEYKDIAESFVCFRVEYYAPEGHYFHPSDAWQIEPDKIVLLVMRPLDDAETT